MLSPNMEKFMLLFIVANTPELIHGDDYCKKDIFQKKFGKTDEKRNRTITESMKACEPECKERYSYIKFNLEQENFTTAIATAKFPDPDQDCWGYELRITEEVTLMNESDIYVEYVYDGIDFRRNVQVKPGVTYRLRINVLPKWGRENIAILQAAKNECEYKARNYSRHVIAPKFESCNVLENELVAVTAYCKEMKRFSVITFSKTMSVIGTCDLIFRKAEAVKNQNSNSTISLIVGGVAALLLLTSFFLYCIAKRWRNRNFLKEFPRTKDTELLGMILHCPGCEVLDEIVKDLVFILKSYNVTVKSPLLEQTMLDAEGGISSFMERNIRQCQFILIVVTERSKAINSSRHRPYQYALRVLDGLASTGLQKVVYIPIYFTQYKNALKHAPTFLFPSFDNGFWLPYQLKKLITIILNDKTVLSEESAKLKLFVEQMEIKTKQLRSENHTNCQCGTCSNDAIDYPESELYFAETLSNPSVCFDKMTSERRKFNFGSFSSLVIPPTIDDTVVINQEPPGNNSVTTPL